MFFKHIITSQKLVLTYRQRSLNSMIYYNVTQFYGIVHTNITQFYGILHTNVTQFYSILHTNITQFYGTLHTNIMQFYGILHTNVTQVELWSQTGSLINPMERIESRMVSLKSPCDIWSFEVQATTSALPHILTLNPRFLGITSILSQPYLPTPNLKAVVSSLTR